MYGTGEVRAFVIGEFADARRRRYGLGVRGRCDALKEEERLAHPMHWACYTCGEQGVLPVQRDPYVVGMKFPCGCEWRRRIVSVQ